MARLPRVFVPWPRVDRGCHSLTLPVAVMDGVVVEPPPPDIHGHCYRSRRQGTHFTLCIRKSALCHLQLIYFQAFTRRRRPGYNRGKMFITVGPDKFSFPSGHATRAVALALFFGIEHPPLHSVVALPAFAAWAAAVCLSRVLLGRHHVLDVSGGIAIGVLEYAIASSLAIGPDAAEGLRQYMFDDDPWSSA